MARQSGTIREIHQRLMEEGHNVRENTLRTWIKQGTLPAAYCGKTAYINYDNVLGILMHGTPRPTDEADCSGIRRLH